MRRLISLLAALGLVLGLASAATAGEFVPQASTLTLTLGGLPGIKVTALPGTTTLVTLNDLPPGAPGFPGHLLGVDNTVWSTINFGPGTSLFTGVPLISNLKVTVANQAGFVQSGHVIPSNQIGGGGSIGPTLGGFIRLSGQTVIHVATVLGTLKIPVPLSHVGGVMGETTMVTVLGNNITATNGPFITAALTITGVTSNLITLPGRGHVQGVGFTLQPTPDETIMTLSTNGGFVSVSGGNALENHTVTVSGTNNLQSGSKAGVVTLVAPIRVATGIIAGNIPAEVELHFEFVPEPGTMLLLVSGAVGLAVIGRRRMRK